MIFARIFIGILIILEVYEYFWLRSVFYSHLTIFNIVFFSILSIFIIGIYTFFNNMAIGNVAPSILNNFFVGVSLSFAIVKILLGIAFLANDIFRLFTTLIENHTIFPLVKQNLLFIKIVFSTVGMIFILMIYGIVYSRYDFKIRNEKIYFDNLPKEFDGYKILQFSDMHCSSMDSPKAVEKFVAMCNQQNPDLIVFTGDFVTFRSQELERHVSTLAKLQANDGKFNVLGNHDYAIFGKNLNSQEKIADVKNLQKFSSEAGFQTLNNELIKLQKNDKAIYLAGVENWGKPPFPQFGNLNKSLKDIDNQQFVILLSHDPSHWRAKVLNDVHNIMLTLSGHTHGMQFGIDLPFFKWSPVQWKYPEWAGLYEQNGKYLYVNRGLGCTAIPMRVGIRPEITIIELYCK